MAGWDVGPISVGWDQILMGWDGMGWDVGQDLTAGRDVGLTFTGRDQTSAGRDVPSRPIRSEERRVGKEWRSRCWRGAVKEKRERRIAGSTCMDGKHDSGRVM